MRKGLQTAAIPIWRKARQTLVAKRRNNNSPANNQNPSSESGGLWDDFKSGIAKIWDNVKSGIAEAVQNGRESFYGDSKSLPSIGDIVQWLKNPISNAVEQANEWFDRNMVMFGC